MLNDLREKKKKICVIGLGYVGLPIALEFAKKFSVIGFDINSSRVDQMRNNIDPSKELSKEDFDHCDIEFTSDLENIREANFYIVAVPTPIDEHKNPDLKALLAACETVGKVLKKGDYVVFESTVYPGCTEEDCIPVLEKRSGLKFIEDFKVGYSPERINPGDKDHTLTKIKKVVSGCCPESLEVISKVYASIITAGIYEASSIKVAEAAKIIENTQRDVNIALMNELSIIFNKMNINSYEVLEAAGTKWNFLNFTPGLVGGHCIGVDPYYLTYKASELGYHSKVILSGRIINDNMGPLITTEVIQQLIKRDKSLKQCKVLIMGATFKENVADIRNSKVADLVNEFQKYYVNVHVTDPFADSEELFHEYNYHLIKDIDKDYDAIILAVNHRNYLELDDAYFKGITAPDAFFFDVKGAFRGKIKSLSYKSL
ncbi:MAG: nucleotide sugar dehydrogenase [Bacteroidota bacterium]|nr:nucleotide sugar dehydrogenase [Bacteroidota bacterium]